MEAYQMNLSELYKHLRTSEHGISTTEARHRLKIHGYNIIEEASGKHPLKILLGQFTSPLIFILMVAGLITFLFQEYKDAIVIALAVLSNAVIGFIQEFNAERSMRALKKMLVQRTIVFRNGEEDEIPAEELVPGDVVILTAGAKVPADIRLIESNDLTADESALTGESLTVEKAIHALSRPHLTPGDQKNVVFMGTTIVKGGGVGVVVKTGGQTILGSIAEKVATVEIAQTPLQVKMNRFAQYVTGIVLSGVVLIFVAGLLKGLSTQDLFFQAIAVAVASIPEGLPIVVTVAMAIGIQRMAKKDTIIRTLPSVETLGSTTVICSDKTGTLTKNQMTVEKIYDGKAVYTVTGAGYEFTGQILHDDQPIQKPHDGLLTLLKIGALCNETIMIHKDTGVELNGDPTEAALIVSAAKAGIHQEKILIDQNRIDMIPFQSGTNYMATLHIIHGKKVMYVKGSPEAIAALSKTGEHADVAEYLSTAESFAKSGLRVLGMAYRELPDNTTHLSESDVSELIFCGLQGMMDPPREEAMHAVKQCQAAGIRVVMITGDHAVTAKAIGTHIGICDHGSRVVTGTELEQMSDADLFGMVKTISVFARVSPNHKLRIVSSLMKHGEVVAVTGDGVNDAPALKAAHLGVAMGKSGTDVAKEAANMILRKDSFESIYQAVYEGRVVFANIRKAVAFLIPTGFAAIITIFVSIVIGIPSPYLAAQLLWINLVASGIQDIALAFEPGDKHLVKEPPRSPSEGIMSKLLWQRSILVGATISAGVLFVYLFALHRGLDLPLARTLAVTTMVFFQFFQVLNARSEHQSVFGMNPLSNKVLFYALIGSAASHLLVLYLPALEWLFSMKPVSWLQWGLILTVSSTIILVVEIDKGIRRAYLQKNANTSRNKG